jgi:hypothetical protein
LTPGELKSRLFDRSDLSDNSLEIADNLRAKPRSPVSLPRPLAPFQTATKKGAPQGALWIDR